MKKTLTIIFKAYAIAGAIWLTFSIFTYISMSLKNSENRISGTIKKIYATNWDNVREVHGLIETNDGKGTILTRIYRAGIKEGDNVTLIVTENKMTNERFISSTIVDTK